MKSKSIFIVHYYFQTGLSHFCLPLLFLCYYYSCPVNHCNYFQCLDIQHLSKTIVSAWLAPTMCRITLTLSLSLALSFSQILPLTCFILFCIFEMSAVALLSINIKAITHSLTFLVTIDAIVPTLCVIVSFNHTWYIRHSKYSRKMKNNWRCIRL